MDATAQEHDVDAVGLIEGDGRQERQTVARLGGLAVEEDSEARVAILAEGCEITELTGDEHAQFRAAVTPLLNEARGTYGREMFDLI